MVNNELKETKGNEMPSTMADHSQTAVLTKSWISTPTSQIHYKRIPLALVAEILECVRSHIEHMFI